VRQHNSHTTTRHLLRAQHLTPIHPTLPSVFHVLPQVITPLLKVLHSLHQLGIVHRDIKPENIFFQADGTLRLGDFGLAINASKERPVSRVGTLEYMAPEVTTEAAQASTTPYCSTASCPQPVLCKIRFDNVSLWLVHLQSLPTGRMHSTWLASLAAATFVACVCAGSPQ
jgi:serine/threonine protein kinase